MRVLQVTAEFYPLLKTGGLADVAGALPKALSPLGCEVRALLPGFPAMREAMPDSAHVAWVTPPWGGDPCELRYGVPAASGVSTYLILAPEFDRPGNPYHDANGHPYGDNHRRFALLSWVAWRFSQGLDAYWAPQIIHAHDWHAGLLPAYLRHYGPSSVKSIMTIHNLAYQGFFDAHVLGELGLPPQAFNVHGLEFHGQISFMKAGLYYADRITTVSPTYAREIQGHEQGCGLEGLLHSRQSVLSGILNGIDDTVWDPTRDPFLPATYSEKNMTGKAACKRALQAEFGLAQTDTAPLFGVVSRLVHQKGFNLVLAGASEILDRGGQMLVLGSGDPLLEAGFASLAQTHPHAVGLRLGYDEALAHRIFGASDVTLVPSLYEPCGLTQMYGLRYGSLPLVRRVGGLADTVVDCSLEEMAEGVANGFVFDAFDEGAYRRAVRRAFALWQRKPEWNRVRRYGMTRALGWNASAEQYTALYQPLISA